MRRLPVTTMFLLCLLAAPVWSQDEPDESDGVWASESDDAEAAGDEESGDTEGAWSDDGEASSEDEYAGEEAPDSESGNDEATEEEEAESADDAESDSAAGVEPDGDAGVDGSNDGAGSGDPVSATPTPSSSPATNAASPTPIGRDHVANAEIQALPTQAEIDAAQGWFVVQNHEGQYAIWPHGRDIPLGWNVIGPVRSKQEALDHLNEIGTDMRPQSLRRRMEEMERSAAGKPDG